MSVVVVSFNVRDLLSTCLESLKPRSSGPQQQIVVVDNGSSDGSAELVRERFPDVLLIESSTNNGYGGAINRGAEVSRGRYLLMLNPDTEIREGAIECLVAVLHGNPDVGVAGPRLRSANGSDQSSRRRFPSPLTALVESTVLQRLWPSSAALKQYYVADRPDERQDVDWLVGACLLVRRSVFDAVGGFDERFTMYSEELDLCHRIRDRGYRVCFEPAAVVIHHEGRSSEQNLARRGRQFAESKVRYFEKYFGPKVGFALRLALLANTVYELAEESAKLLVRHRSDLRRQRIRAWLLVAADQVAELVRVSLAPHQPVANATRIGSSTSPGQDSEDTSSR